MPTTAGSLTVRRGMFGIVWRLARDTVTAFIADNLLSRGAAIAYYTIFSIAPVLIIVIAVAGLTFGEAAARGAIVAQLGGLMGARSADILQEMIRSAADRQAGTWSTVAGIVTLLITASGVFGEMQAALNIVWKAAPRRSTVSRLIRARLMSLGLVLAFGFLLMVSLVVNTALSALHDWVNDLFPAAHLLLQGATFLASFALISLLFAAIYKVLPDTDIAWRDVAAGAVVTALLFTLGKSAIGFYIGSSAIASSYGAAGALAVVLVWIYYSAQIFLLGAEFTHAWAGWRAGSAGAGTATGGAAR
jgi:membrane protein